MTRVVCACLLAAAMLALAGCGTTEIDADKAEALIRDSLRGQPAQAVNCPEGVESEAGATFECAVEYSNGRRARVTVHIEDDGGRISIGPNDFKSAIRLPRDMDFKLELIPVPVTDVDRAKAFYEQQAGFAVDNDVTVREGLRFVQLTPPGSGCSVSIGEGITEMKPGSVQGLQLVVDDIEAARDELSGRGLEVSEVQDFPWGRFVFFSDPDGNGWAVQQIPDYGEGRTQPEGG